jgi:hypothetical protein
MRGIDMKKSRLVTLASAVALLAGLAGTAVASAPTAATGIAQATNITGFEPREVGANFAFTQTSTGTMSGTLEGTTESTENVVIHPDGRVTAHGTLICGCTVDGKSGRLDMRWSSVGQVLDEGLASVEGRFVIVNGTEELSGLSGVLEFQGSIVNGLASTPYTGEIHDQP